MIKLTKVNIFDRYDDFYQEKKRRAIALFLADAQYASVGSDGRRRVLK